MSSYSWTNDGKFLLIAGQVKSIWRHSSQAPYYLLNVDSKKIIAIGNGSENLRNVKLSPDGKKVGFVRNHNLFVADLKTGIETALTEAGNENILFGEFDWVYEEEFSISDGWQWSPDGSKIAFWKFDQTHVKEFHLIDEIPNYNVITPLKYPKAGERNSIVKIGVIDLKSSNINWMDIGKDEDIYIPRIFWTNSSDILAIVRLNRKQNYLELLMANTNSGKGSVALTDSDSCWVDVDDNSTIFLRNSNRFIWLTEKKGFRHAYLYNYNGNLINQITSGNWEITSALKVDEKNEQLYFYGKKDSEIEQHLYKVKFDGTNLMRLTSEPGWHTVNISPLFNSFVDEFSSANHTSRTYLKNNSGELIVKLKENDLLSFKEYDFSFPEFGKIKTSDGAELNYYMMKPAGFNPDKKYPVIVFGYSGPGAQHVINRWIAERDLWHQMMTEKGFIIFCVDARGTGGRGKEFKNLVYGNLGKWSVNDQVEGAKYLRSLPYVDGEQIGFWGWSGGGYLCLMLMTRATDYFKVGVSIAPVSDFRNYDAIWSERYLGLLKENPEWYDISAPLNYAAGLKGKLLIVHGTGDDNVHYQNAMQMVRQLQLNEKMFDLMLYPNKNHSLSGENARKHLYMKMTEYFLSNLR
jgi:dipeptidyl-peptidase-4